MNDSRLPKICFLHLYALRTTFNSNRHNWVQQLSDVLSSIQESELLNNLDANHWKAKKKGILAKFDNHLRKIDAVHYRQSSACQLILPSPLFKLLHFNNMPLYFIKPPIQLRLSNIYSCHITIDRHTHKLHPRNTCSLCHLQANESVEHFLTRCPFFPNMRSQFWGLVIALCDLLCHQLRILVQLDPKRVFAYLKACFNFKESYCFIY